MIHQVDSANTLPLSLVICQSIHTHKNQYLQLDSQLLVLKDASVYHF